jgi:hypothetical protein
MVASHDFAIVDLVWIDVPQKSNRPERQQLRAAKESSIRSPTPDENEHDFESGSSARV